MTILLVFAFISGLLTILAPCIWPLLPIILSATATGGKKKPFGITLGIMASFAFFTLTLSYIVKIIPFDPNILRIFAVIVIGFFGLTLIVPALNKVVEGWVSRLSGKVGKTFFNAKDEGLRGGFVTGCAIGIVWSPCAGPILATIATLAATSSLNIGIVLTTFSYVLGVGIPLFVFASFGTRLFQKSKGLNRFTGRIQQIFGVIMIATALLIITNYDKVLQVKLLDLFPSYSDFIFKLENNPGVKNELNKLRGGSQTVIKNQGKPMDVVGDAPLPFLGEAPEFVGIHKWLNLPEGQRSISLKDLRGKVVLVDFWTYTCINCIRTFPHITRWYDTYKDNGFVVVGVHTPEFEFEKNTSNVQMAMAQYGIHYPVAQDNDYATWNAYQNHYWPAHYLIDANGNVRHVHFGEGGYEEMEFAIRVLLEEAGRPVVAEISPQKDTAPRLHISPETYLGTGRMDRFSSNESPKLGSQTFTLLSDPPANYFGYEGEWNLSDESGTAGKNASLTFHFNAEHVYLVMHPGSENDNVTILLDGKPVSSAQAGEDVVDGVVRVTEPRLYELIHLKNTSTDHVLKIIFNTPGTEVFAFTFG